MWCLHIYGIHPRTKGANLYKIKRESKNILDLLLRILTQLLCYYFMSLHGTYNIPYAALESHFDGDGFSAPFCTVADSFFSPAASVFRGFPTIRSQRVCFSATSGAQFVSSLSSAGTRVPPVPHRPWRSQREHMAATPTQPRATCCVNMPGSRRHLILIVVTDHGMSVTQVRRL